MSSKVYNVKETDLGKITFDDGALFIELGIDTKFSRIQERLVLGSIDDCIKHFSSWAMQMTRENLENPLEFHEKIVEWVIENWLHAVEDLKLDMAEKYGFMEFRDQDTEQWLRSEPEVVPLAVIHIAARFTNGYVKCPVNNLEVTCKFIKTLVVINFWEEGSPMNSDPIK